MTFRTERIVRLYGETDKTLEQRLKEKDEKRRVNYRLYTEQEWAMSQNYHICLDSGVIGIGIHLKAGQNHVGILRDRKM